MIAMKLTAFDIADRLGLRRPLRNTVIRRIVTDSRQVEENTLFAALVGEKSDGHDFIAELDKKFNNILFLCSRKTGAQHDELVCDDVLRALGDIAALHLSTMPAKRVAVTGSVGKTTTKEMICHALSGRYTVQKSLANRNNELGMPLTAFTVGSEHQAAIFEMGMRGRGQIDYLARRVKPHIGVITNIGVSHIELLGSRENICAAKMELAAHIAPDGVLILNGDEPLLREAAQGVSCKVRWFGLEQAADYFADNIILGESSVRFTLRYQGKALELVLPEGGKHIVYDALAAFAAASEMGVPPEMIAELFAGYQSGGLRQHIYREDDLIIFDDTYNAAPESMEAALRVMAAYPNRKIAVLADMLELGDYSAEAHSKVGKLCAECADKLICYGHYAPLMTKAFGREADAAAFANRDEALSALCATAAAGDMILFKGSHSMACDQLLKEFLKRWKNK